MDLHLLVRMFRTFVNGHGPPLPIAPRGREFPKKQARQRRGARFGCCGQGNPSGTASTSSFIDVVAEPARRPGYFKTSVPM
jgi:hypothetical protein